MSVPRSIYLASSWRNKHQPEVLKALRTAGHVVYDFRNPAPGNYGFQWSAVDPDWTAWDMETYRQLLDHPVAVEGYRNDYHAMFTADTCVLLLPSGRSAHLEGGWFAGAGKDLFVLIPEPIEPDLMFKLAKKICLSIKELLEALA